MNHVIKMIVIISLSNIFFYINKVIIKHICYVLRILMDNIFLNTMFPTLRFFLLMMLMHKVCFISFFCSIEFMFIIKKILSNLASDKILKMPVTIFWKWV